ncbi:hypothetical protein GGH94_004631 [Coemansia aciculifera]|uniref:Uncharacterized protein n=2 Tax=Coemansia TaxID=4863 RepID=A0A9W8GWP3_9FUNG|nr:hypothetical protein GGI19_005420 [Coemansia pectinata]KAJ2861856.1 hypothetical protein GGH94_004631 [Coemansia aciculifera]KAJ2871198.1 hypothetical protein GGH93_005000 [Coemansia aciculifera]
MGNGNKAQMKRERNAKAGTEAKSQLKINVASKTIQCKVCFQTFMCTSKVPELTLHADNKHSKTLLECFPEHKENETKSDNKPNAKVSGKK